MELYLHSLIRLNGVVLSKLNTRITYLCLVSVSCLRLIEILTLVLNLFSHFLIRYRSKCYIFMSFD
jgi:hypothetical protein